MHAQVGAAPEDLLLVVLHGGVQAGRRLIRLRLLTWHQHMHLRPGHGCRRRLRLPWGCAPHSADRF